MLTGVNASTAVDETTTAVHATTTAETLILMIRYSSVGVVGVWLWVDRMQSKNFMTTGNERLERKKNSEKDETHTTT